MTDLEMTKLCAEAMGYKTTTSMYPEKLLATIDPYPKDHIYSPYDPLHDDAQAMALVKKFKLYIAPPVGEFPTWEVCSEESVNFFKNIYLNRAIMECVANMMKK